MRTFVGIVRTGSQLTRPVSSTTDISQGAGGLGSAQLTPVGRPVADRKPWLR